MLAALSLALLACSRGPTPPSPPYVAETTDPVPTPQEVRDALALAARAEVFPSDVGDLSGRWSQPEQALGDDLHAASHLRRHPVQEGVFGLGMATAYRAKKPLLVVAFEGVEVVNETGLCVLWTEARIEWTADTPEAHGLAGYLTPETMNQSSCMDVVELKPNRLQLEHSGVRWLETRHD